jgi:hypothetical protein
MGLGHCRLVLSGSAPLSPHVLEFLRIVLAPATVSTRHFTAHTLQTADCLTLVPATSSISTTASTAIALAH